MASIGVTACFRASGTGRPQSQRVEVFGITGVDGVGVHLLGNFGTPVSWLVQNYGTSTTLATWYQALVAKTGTVQTIIADEGGLFANQLIENVSEPQKQTAVNYAGSTELWTVTVTSRTV